MYFAPIDSRLPIELLVIRLAGAVETQQEKANLLAAWKQCLSNGPSAPRRKIAKVAPAPAKAFTKDSAAIPARRIEQLERCLEVN